MPLREYLNTLYFHVGISILLTGKRGKRRKREKERKRKIEKERERERESYNDNIITYRTYKTLSARSEAPK